MPIKTKERTSSMKKLGLVVVSLITAAALTVPAVAKDKAAKGEKKADKQEAFKKADTSADGKLSLDEFKTMITKGDAEKKFTVADADKDGFVTPEELKAAHGKKKGKDCKDCQPAVKEEAKQ